MVQLSGLPDVPPSPSEPRRALSPLRALKKKGCKKKKCSKWRGGCCRCGRE